MCAEGIGIDPDSTDAIDSCNICGSVNKQSINISKLGEMNSEKILLNDLNISDLTVDGTNNIIKTDNLLVNVNSEMFYKNNNILKDIAENKDIGSSQNYYTDIFYNKLTHKDLLPQIIVDTSVQINVDDTLMDSKLDLYKFV